MWVWLLLAALLGLLGWRGWVWWRAQAAHEDAAAAGTAERLDALTGRVDALRRDQRAQLQRLQQADATNRVLRDELLGVGQRAGLLEESIARLADPDRHGAQALRLDETELLLVLGEQRLLIAGDLDGARRAYALASGVLEGVDDPAYLSLRQVLVQERAALDALGSEPRATALARLDAFAQQLRTQPPPSPGERAAANAPWWRRAFGSLVQVQPSDRAIALHGSDRRQAELGLQVELSLARAAVERRDVDGFRQAIGRADLWLTRLWPDSPALRQQRDRLQALAALPLSLSLPTLGSTLQQLRQLRAAP
ncbi:uroporphyrinogen-III C-methyltransferase [Lysobacter olei]